MMIYSVKRSILITTVLLGLSVIGNAFAENVRPLLHVPLYYAATCDHLTGTWLGYYTDPQGLLIDRAINITLQATSNHVVGKVTPLESRGVGSIHGQLWATCDHGRLNHVFVGSSKQCGHFAPAGGLVAANTLLLYLPYENAMTETNVLAVLHRENDQYTGGQFPVDVINSVHTCH